MKVLNIGSMNIDYVYSVDHIILPGETQSTFRREIFLGGKGINQSIALVKAGVRVFHAGLIGEDGGLFLEACKEYGVDSTFISKVPIESGHTIIQVDKQAQNSILLFGGANQAFTEEYIDSVLENFSESDFLILQNEINLLSYIVNKAYEKKMKIVLNPSPFNDNIFSLDLSKISYFILNEIEGEQITREDSPQNILNKLIMLYSEAKFILTLGKNGAYYADSNVQYFQPAFPVQAVDTTAAGDTFTGYFIAGLVAEADIPSILKMSAKAASLSVTRHGAVPSIPLKEEVLQAMER